MFLFKTYICFGLFIGIVSTFNITSPIVTNWGTWGNFQRCPNGTYAQGFQLKTERFLYIDGDDTALNSIRIFCGDPSKGSTHNITSSQGFYGTWGRIHSCHPGFLHGFQMRVVPNVTTCVDSDNFAATNIRFHCKTQMLEGDGLSIGNWGEAQLCNRNQAICGIQTQIEGIQYKWDDTALNNVRMECCDLTSNDLNCDVNLK